MCDLNMNNTNNNSMPNSLDLAAIYGITPYREAERSLFVPTLEELAAYNQYLLSKRESPPSLQSTQQQITTNTSPIMSAQSNAPANTPTTPSNTTTPLTNTNQTAPTTQTAVSTSTPEELMPIMPYNQPFPVTGESIEYLNGFLRTQLGRRVKLEFIVGTSNLESRDGILLAVGANFILINPENSNDLMTCDFYNLKFVTFYY